MPPPKKKRALLALRILLPAVSVVCTVVFVPWNLLFAWAAPLPDTIQEQLGNSIDRGLDGIIVYVDQSGKLPQFYSAGWKNRENKIPADPHALFKIASISKLYIAAATAKLVAAHRLSLDGTLDEYLPEYQGSIENADQITLKHLLQHRSGIPNYTDHPGFSWANPPKSKEIPLNLIFDMPADFSPGADYRYSNSNYLLIGEILDKTLGYSHHRYLKDEVLAPLNLHHTYSLLSEVDLDDVTSGYSVGYPDDIKYNDYIFPGGSMVATAQDVGIFLRALNDGTLLTESEQAIYSSVYVYEHTGLLPGYSSIARHHKDIDAVVIQFVNTSGGESWTLTEINYNRILKILRKQSSR